MLIGIIANITKENIFEVVSSFIQKLKDNNLDYMLTNTLSEDKDRLKILIDGDFPSDDKEIYEKCDLIISIGGDGTMLATAYNAYHHNKPVLGVNLGKMGFLVEADIIHMDQIIQEIKKEDYTIDERMVITGSCEGYGCEKLFAINDIVIEKGGWPKMIELTVWIDEEYVTTFSADGLIVATPTGSTGYSISVGGPIVTPQANVITLSPISPHSLTVRPLVIPSSQEILIRADSLHKDIKVSCDGQRVFTFPPPFELTINKCENPLRLIHTSLTTYFETLRRKLLWGVDVRFKQKDNKGDK
ncbi:MAG TPA: NAD(+)/NADH kinase [Ignavibacteriaceae bacterium]|nr:NAD(+)/NADH kinase [Ignavibacteriaceae bacterium]